LYNKQHISFILKILFILIAFIHLLKKESEANKCVDYSEYFHKSYSEFVIDHNDNQNLFFNENFSADTRQNNPINKINSTRNQSILSSSIHYCINKLYTLFPIFLPKTKILKVLQKKNICHKSSDDKTAPVVLC